MSFVFYNPKTNTIERRQPTQPNAFQMPYLLNIQPQDLNYAMKNTNDVRSYPSTVSYPQNYDQERPDKENVSYNRQPQPRPSNHQDTYKPSKEFLMMEDFNENDIGRTQTYKPSRDQNRNIQPQRTQELRRTSPQDKRERRSHPVQEEEAREEFNMMRPEDLILKYRPEDYSINERILNARFVREEQEKTRKFVLDRIGADIKVMEGKANEIEKDIKESEQETKALEAKTQQIWQEFERKKFELKAKEILNRIDDAIDADKEEEVDENRFDDFYNENRALYDEIDRVLDQDEGEEEVTYIQETDRSRGPEKPKYKATGYGRASSSGWRNPRITPSNRSNNYSNVHSSVNSRSKKGLDKMFGQKKAMNPVAKSKPNTVAKRPIGSIANQKSGVSQKNEVVFKNPKRVEDALQKAKAIVNLY